MRNKIFILIIAAIVMASIMALSGPAAIFIAKRQLKNTFKGSIVTIEQCKINPLNSIIFSGIEINEPSSYNIKCEQISMRYDLYFLLTKGIVEFSASGFFGGKVDGNIKITLGKSPAYVADINLRNIDLDIFVKDFKLEKKMQVTGRLDGNIFIKGAGSRLKEVTGNLQAISPGGELTIKDTDYLKNMPIKSGVSWEDLVASLKNYVYNIGALKTSLENDNLIFTVSLSGETGKRNFTVVLHDFKI